MLAIVVYSRSPYVYPLLTHVSGFSAAPIVAISPPVFKTCAAALAQDRRCCRELFWFFCVEVGVPLPGVATHVYVRYVPM